MGRLKTWTARVLAVLVALSAAANSAAASPAAMAGSLMVFVGFVWLVFRRTGGEASGD